MAHFSTLNEPGQNPARYVARTRDARGHYAVRLFYWSLRISASTFVLQLLLLLLLSH